MVLVAVDEAVREGWTLLALWRGEIQEIIGSQRGTWEAIICLEITMSGSCLNLPDLRHVMTVKVSL
jgi:hypothetical protein